MAEEHEKIEKVAVENEKSHRSRSGFWFGVIIILIVISLAAAGYYLVAQLRERQTKLPGEVKGQVSKQISDYQAQLTAIQSQLSTIEANVANKDAHFTKTLDDYVKLQNEKLDSTRKEFNEAIQRIQRQLGKTRGDWLVADSEYLLSVANERLHLIGDVKTTIEALEAADQRLRESGDAAVYPVREEIAKEIAALKDITPPDIVGTYSSVQTLQDNVDKLSLLLPYAGKQLSHSTEIHSHTSKTEPEHGLLNSVLGHLEGIVTIRHTNQPVTAIITPEQASFIREQLKVKLEMVKISLVQQNEALYESSLTDTKQWINKNFTMDADARKFVGELDHLKTMKIRSHFPDISKSLKMLRDISKLRIETDKALQPLQETEPAAAPASSSSPVTAPTPAPVTAPAQESKAATQPE